MFFGRLLPVVRTFISLPAGIAGMDPVRFGVYTTIGCIPWTAALAWAGYAVGANWQHVVSAFHGVTYALIAAIVLLVLIGIGLLVRRRIRDRGQDDGQEDGGDHDRHRDLASDHEGR